MTNTLTACGHPECAPLGDTPTENFHTIEPTECQIARVREHGLCPECAEASGAWLDYRIVRPINIVQIGNPTDARLRENQRATFEEWQRTITFQQRLIVRICMIRHDWTGGVIEVGLP
jgi:hypothetical protein